MCCCAALLLWVTMTMTRLGKTTEQMQETGKRHTPDLARGLEASLLAPALPSHGLVFRSVRPQLTSSFALVSGPRVCLQRRYPLFGALSGCTYGYTSKSTSVSMRDPGPGTVRKTPNKSENSHTAAKGSDHGVQCRTFVLTPVR